MRAMLNRSDSGELGITDTIYYLHAARCNTSPARFKTAKVSSLGVYSQGVSRAARNDAFQHDPAQLIRAHYDKRNFGANIRQNVHLVDRTTFTTLPFLLRLQALPRGFEKLEARNRQHRPGRRLRRSACQPCDPLHLGRNSVHGTVVCSGVPTQRT